VQRISPTTGAITNIPMNTTTFPVGVIPPDTSQYGAAWTYVDGNLGFDENTGDLFQISVTNPVAASPIFDVVDEASGPASNNNDGTSCGNPANLTLAKTASTAAAADGSLVAAGGKVTWTLTATNAGPGDSSGFVVNDPVPAGYSNIATSTAGCTVGPQAAPSSNTVPGNVQCVEGPLAVGATFTVTITATAPASGCLTNAANVLGNEQTNGAQPSNSVQTCVASYTLAKTASATPNPAAAGSVVTYTVTVKNTSPTGTTTPAGASYTAADPASFSDNLSNVLGDATFVAGSATVATATPGPVPTWNLSQTGTTLTGSGPLAFGQTLTITYQVKIDNPVKAGDATGGTALNKSVSATNPTGSCAGTNPAAATGANCQTTTDVPDLVASKSVSPASGTTVTPGQQLTYTLTFANASGTAAAPVSYTDNLADVTDDATITTVPKEATGAGLVVSAVAGGAFTVTGFVAEGATATVTYTVTVDNGATTPRRRIRETWSSTTTSW
jgi:uncharacterized repeat protein (TIGR01451 family)